MNCQCCQSNEFKKRGFYRNKNFQVQRFECLRCGTTFAEKQPLDGLRVDFKQACQVVNLLCEGMGVRAVARVTGLHRDTVLAILESAGAKFAAFLDEHVQGVKAVVVQADEIHSFVYSKQQNTPEGETEQGDQFTFLAIDRDSKLIVNHQVGKRTRNNAIALMSDLKRRTAGRFQLTTDGWAGFCGMESSVAVVFGQDVDYATETKYFASPGPFLPRRLISIRRKRKIGTPDMSIATTCHVERTNLSARQFTRRLTRCTLGYSRTLENHKHAVAMLICHFNFCRVHSAHGMTPARAAGLTDHTWTIQEILKSGRRRVRGPTAK